MCVSQLKFQCIAKNSLIFLQYLLNVFVKKQLMSGKSKAREFYDTLRVNISFFNSPLLIKRFLYFLVITSFLLVLCFTILCVTIFTSMLRYVEKAIGQ